jgi:hypothetical protein
MDRKHLISLLQQSAAADFEQTPFCPGDEEIAAYVDGAITAEQSVSLERHLPDCPACIQRVGLLTRLMRDNVRIEKPMMPEAHKPATWKPHRWAVAATVVLAVGWLTWAPIGERGEYSETRTLQSQLTRPEILAPDSAFLENRDSLFVRWTDVPGSLYYEVRIVSDAGDLVSLQRVDDSEWAPTKHLALQPGREYYIRVDAFLSDSQSIRSEHILFRVKD